MTVDTSATGPVLLVSPREPSGVSWIINCLLELGIRVDLQPTVDQIFGIGQQPASAMWLPEADGRWRLHPRASALKKWLPILSREETFSFRPIAPILHVQRLPRRGEPCRQVILFVRDLRDALHSLYRRLQPEISWPEFVAWPHAETLLDAIDHWRLFMECWLERSPVFVGRFEDYKADARGLLERVLHVLGVDCTTNDITLAVERSSYAAAAAAEARYRQQHPLDAQVANRAGLVGEWKTVPDLQPTIEDIERSAGSLLKRLGYSVPNVTQPADSWTRLGITRELSSFSTLTLPERLRAVAESGPDAAAIDALRQWAEPLSPERLQQARLEAEESRLLLRHLQEFSEQYAPELAATLQATALALAEGSDFHLARIRALLLSRRRDSATEPR